MPFCQTPGCSRKDISPEEVVWDEMTQTIRCKECVDAARVLYTSAPEESVQYAVGFSSTQGLLAKANIAGINLSVAVSMSTIKGWLGKTEKPQEIVS